MEDVKLLKKVEIFKGLSSFEVAKIGKLLKGQSYAGGSQVVTMGEEGDSLFIVKNGEVAVSRTDGKGEAEILALLGPGDHFGEIALIDSQPRSADVYAKSDSKLLQIKKGDLEKLLGRDIDLAAKVYLAFAVALCKRLRDTNENLLLLRKK